MPASRTNAIINGTDLGVYLGGNLIALATSCSISLSTDMRDTSNKDVAGWSQSLPGVKKWSVSCDGLVNYSATNSFVTLTAAWLSGTKLTLTMKIASNPSGDYYWNGSAYINSLSQNAPFEGNVTFQVSFNGSGSLEFKDPIA